MRQITLDDHLLIKRIDAAIDRLRQQYPITSATSVCNLLDKRVMVVTGQYQIEDVTETAIATVGRLICKNVKSRPWIRARQPGADVFQLATGGCNE